MNIVGIGFSYAENSLQHRGLTLLSDIVPMKVYGMLDFDMPICNSNKSDGIVPDSVEKFDAVMKDADILIFAISEATAHYCTAFKNAMDWLVVKSKFNAKLGTDYTISNKPVFVITFTPTTQQPNGARHFDMTAHLLDKLGANVIDTTAINDSWRTIVPGNASVLSDYKATLMSFVNTYTSPIKEKPLDDNSSPNWLNLYNSWDSKWTNNNS